MKIYMAPMEGVTNYVFRKAYIKNFNGVDKFFTPFITPHMKRGFSRTELMELDTGYNKGQHLIPQILTCSSDDFIKLANEIRDMGYDELNLNLGCPSATVTSKNRGAGFLTDIYALEKFFYNIFEKLGNLNLSVKTRIGFSEYDEWESIAEVYSKFDFCEIIIHPRLREDFYKNQVYMPAFEYALNRLSSKLIYNGDIHSFSDLDKIDLKASQGGCGNILNKADGIMLGRGLIKNPLLPHSLKEGREIYDTEKMILFINDIRDEYLSLDFGERNTLFKLKEIWGFILEDSDKYSRILKKLRKSNSISEYNIIVKNIHEVVY